MRSIIWTTNEEFAEKLLTQIIGSQPVIRKRKTKSEYWIQYGDEYNIVYWIRTNDCFCGLRCDVSYVDIDTCSVQYFDTIIRIMTSLGKYGRCICFSGGEQLTNDEQLKWIKSVLAHRTDVQDHQHDGNRLE